MSWVYLHFLSTFPFCEIGDEDLYLASTSDKEGSNRWRKIMILILASHAPAPWIWIGLAEFLVDKMEVRIWLAISTVITPRTDRTFLISNYARSLNNLDYGQCTFGFSVNADDSSLGFLCGRARWGHYIREKVRFILFPFRVSLIRFLKLGFGAIYEDCKMPSSEWILGYKDIH